MNAFILLLALCGQGPPKALPSAQAPSVTPDVDGDVPPPKQPLTAPPAAAPAPQVITLHVAGQPAQAPPPSPPQQQAHVITLKLVTEPAPPPPTPVPQTITLAVQPTAAVAQAEPATAAIAVAPGPIRRAIGGLGEVMARQKMMRLYVPAPQTAMVSMPAQQVVYAPPSARIVAAEPVLASPQSAPRKCWWRH